MLPSTCLQHRSSLCHLPKPQVSQIHYCILLHLPNVNFVKHHRLSQIQSKQHHPAIILSLITAPWPHRTYVASLSLNLLNSNESIWIYVSLMHRVFPAEACETLAGDACDVEMFPETEIKQQPNPKLDPPTSEQVDREHLEYSSPNT